MTLVCYVCCYCAGPNCGHAEHANGLLCDAYGHDSDICSSARAHFNVFCSETSMVAEATLGESMSIGQATYGSTAAKPAYSSSASYASDAKDAVKAVETAVDDAAQKADRGAALGRKMAPVLASCKDSDAAAHTKCDGHMDAARAKFKAHAAKYAAAKERKQKQDKAEAEKKAASSYTSAQKVDVENGKAYASAAGDLYADL